MSSIMGAVKVELEVDAGSECLLACRICLTTDTALFNVYENGLEKTFLELFGTVVSPTDGCPQHVCGWCHRQLRRAAALRACCLRADQLLKQALQQQPNITTTYIRNIDRVTNKFILHVTTQTPTEVIDYDPNEIPVKCELDSLETEFSEGNKLIKFEEDHIEFEDDVDYKDEVRKTRASKRKKNVVSNTKTNTTKAKAKAKVKVPKKQKQTKKIRKMFDSEEDFPKFESKYNMEIVVLTMEQQMENMEARKNSSNYMNSPFKCELCFKGFSSDATFKNHNLKHHDPSIGEQCCNLCHARFRIPAFLRTHAETHRLKFVCRDCRFVASNRYHAITHSREHSGYKYVCKYCGATFKKPSTHGTHVRIQHPTHNTSCDVCGETFQGECGLRMHKTRAHRLGSEADSESLKCSTCGVHFASSYARSRHIYTALDNVCDPNKRACTLCGENLASEEMLQKHTEDRHTKPQTKCDECDKTFLSEASLSVHYERVHLQVKSVRRKASHHAATRKQYGGAVMCELCGKRCKNSTILKYHQRSHTGEKPHQCPRCPKRFGSPMLLHGHLRSHTGEKPYKCTQCHKSFAQKSALTAHKTVHTGEKPFECSICGKAFTQAASVHTHVKYVHMKIPAPPRRRNVKRE